MCGQKFDRARACTQILSLKAVSVRTLAAEFIWPDLRINFAAADRAYRPVIVVL